MPAPELNPLQQTIFEEGPKAGFVPPESVNVYKETPTQFAQQPIGVEGADIDWYALGESGFKIANETFGAVINHLISSKGNAIAELKDVYSTKLNDAYLKLNTEQSNAKARGEAVAKPIMDELITNINDLRTNWDKEARKVVENNEGSLFQPAIDYWDPKLDIKTLGSKYQDLALRVRSSDRDISAASTKLLFDAQFNNIGKQKKTYDLEQMKNGGQPYDPAATGVDMVASGEAPINETPGGLPPGSVEGGTPYFMERNNEGVYVSKKDVADRDMIKLNPATGLWYINPEADLRTISSDERVYKTELGQNHFDPEIRKRSAVMSVEGDLTPETASRLKFIGTKNTATPEENFEAGLYVSMIPDSQVGSQLKKQGFNEEQAGRLLLLADAVRSGVSIENMGIVSDIRAEDIIASQKQLALVQSGSMDMRDGLSKDDMEVLANSVLGPALGSILQLDAAGVADLALTKQREGLIDAGGNSIANVLKTSPALQKTALRLMATIESRRSQFTTNGVLDPVKLKPFVDSYLASNRQQAGMVMFTDQNKNKITLRNLNLTFSNGLKPETLVKAVLNTNQSEVNVDYTPEGAAELALNNAKGTFPTVDQPLYTALYRNLGVERAASPTDQTKLLRDLPLGEQIRLALACTPVILEKYGFVFDPALSEDENFTRKSQAAMKAWTDILPASQWEASFVVSPKNQAYTTAPNGGIPIGFRTMMTKGGVNLLPFAVPPSATTYSNGWFTPAKQDGEPLFRLPASNNRLNTDNVEKSLRLDQAHQDNKVDSYNIITRDSAAAHRVQPIAVAISQAGFTSSSAVAKVFSNKNDVFLVNMTTEEISTELIVNYDKLITAAEASKETAGVVPILRNDFAGGKDTAPIMFSQENLQLMRVQAEAKGAKTMADFASFVIDVAVAKLKNKKELNPWDKQAAKNAEAAMNAGQANNMGDLPREPVLKIIKEGDLLVPSGPNEGTILYEPNSTPFVKGIETLSKTGYNIYKSKEGNVFYAFKAGETVDTEGLDLYFDAVRPNEDSALYSRRFNATFGSILITNKNAETIKSTVRSMVGAAAPMPIEASFQKQTVLPSVRIKAFQNELASFLDRNDLMSSTDPATKLEIKTYDFAGLYLETGELPNEWSDLPAKFALPGNSRHSTTQKPTKPSAFATLLQAVPNATKETGTGPDPFQQLGQNLQERGYKSLKAELLREALTQNNLDSVLSQTIGDPISILRTRDEDVRNLPQDTANFLLSAFDKQTSTRVIQEILDEDEQPMYGVSKSIYMKVIANFVAKKWEPAALEYQIRTALKNDRALKEKQGSTQFMTVNEAIASIDSSSFPLDPQVEKQWIKTAVEAYNVEQRVAAIDDKVVQPSGLNKKKQDKIKEYELFREFELKLRDPKQFADLRQDFLMHWLLPQSRATKFTPDDLWIKTITKRLLAK
jgi:hypothetical protein